ncbi:MAG: ABC transporter ATP-binding protein [Oscillospiraceae bacterium]|jgi:iron complex transport system ATP-binding protein|nr:ABC transporter ATP-binding protein [Oscillospiraceae bacterium]
MNVLQAERLTFAYDKSEPVLKDLSFYIEQGSLVTLLGPNGAGKSTLISCLCGLFTPRSGQVLLNGKEILALNQRSIAHQIAYVPQQIRLAFPYKVRDYIAMGRAPYLGIFTKPGAKDYQSVDDAMERMGISQLSNKACTQISGGEAQLVDICRAIIQEPDILVFDEPTSALDYGNQVRVLRLIRDLNTQGYTVILTTHNPDHAILLNGVAALLDKNGVLTIGKAADVINSDSVKRVYGMEICVDYISAVNRIACVTCAL